MVRRLFQFAVLSALMLLATVSVATAQIRAGVVAGIGFPDIKTETTVLNTTVSHRSGRLMPGFHVGGLVGFDFPTPVVKIGLEGNLLFTRLGGKEKVDVPGISTPLVTVGGGTSTTTTSLWYLQLPIRVVGSINAGPVAIFAGVGPQFNLGLAGSVKTVYTPKSGDKQTTTLDVQWGESNNGLNRFNIDVTTQIGVRFWKMQAAFYYNIGFMDIQPADNLKFINNSDLGLSLAFLFL